MSACDDAGPFISVIAAPLPSGETQQSIIPAANGPIWLMVVRFGSMMMAKRFIKPTTRMHLRQRGDARRVKPDSSGSTSPMAMGRP
jgi:hypothetical protein